MQVIAEILLKYGIWKVQTSLLLNHNNIITVEIEVFVICGWWLFLRVEFNYEHFFVSFSTFNTLSWTSVQKKYLYVEVAGQDRKERKK